MRLFTAIEFDAQLRSKISKIQSELRQYCEKGHFTREDNFHLTLIFLGERKLTELQNIISALELSVQGLEPFKLKIAEPGSFTKASRKILWLGLSGALQDLSRLYARLENCLVEKQVISQRQKYSPHITIGREILLKASESIISNDITMPEIIVPVTKISLMESIRVQDRLIYRPIHVVEL